MRLLRLEEFILCISFLTLLFPCFKLSYAKDRIEQKTSGNQSPAAYTESGDIIINYGMALEVKELLEKYINSKDAEIKELKQRLIDIHKKEFNSLPAEAEKWAIHFLSTMSVRQDRLKMEELKLVQARNDRRLESEKLIKRIEVIFEYIFSTIDERINKLRNLGDDLSYKADGPTNLFTSNSNGKIVRAITFRNGCRIDIRFRQGQLRNGLLAEGPILYLLCQCGEKREKQLFQIKEPQRGSIVRAVDPLVKDVQEPKIANVIYSIKDGPPINKEFRENLNKSLDEALGRVYYWDSQILPNST